MPLMLDNMRAEFAQFLADDPASRYRMDKALAHVVTIAYERGLDDGRRSHDQRFDDGGKHILDTYYKLHATKLVGQHWLWAAIERVAAGESEDEVMREALADQKVGSGETEPDGHNVEVHGRDAGLAAMREENKRMRYHLTELAKFADRAGLVLATLESETSDEEDQVQQIIDGISTWAPPAILGDVVGPNALGERR